MHAFLLLGERLTTVIKDKIQYKLMEKSDILISLDRLTRFKDPADKYPRVYTDILTKFLISPKLSKKQIDLLDADEINKFIELIWNSSVSSLFGKPKTNNNFFTLFKLLDKNAFIINNPHVKKLMAAKLNVDSIFELDFYNDDLPQNLKLFNELAKCTKDSKLDKVQIYDKALELRKIHKFKFPVSKLVLVEGITEEILLPKFAEKLDYDFDKNGVFVLSVGGKSKIIQLYCKLRNILKIPVIILLDNDAMQIFEQVKKNLKRKDKAMIIKKGEFEDILPLNLIKKTINNEFYDIEKVKISDLKQDKTMCEILHEIYKLRGIGEFQKAHFAQCIANSIESDKDISIEIEDIINYIEVSNEKVYLDSFLI